MARTVRGGEFENRSARLRLAPRQKPYWRDTDRAGVHLGYRRIQDKNGSWIARHYLGAEKYVTQVFGMADDYADADGLEVLTYRQALDGIVQVRPKEISPPAAYTVADAVRDYLDHQAMHRKGAKDTASKLHSYVTPKLGHLSLADLTRDDVAKWLAWAVDHKPPGRRRKGKKVAKKAKPVEGAHAEEVSPAEKLRRKKSTLNRVITAFKATLNFAHENEKVASDAAWSRLRKFEGVDGSRDARLTAAEAARLVNASAPDFRQLVRAAILTGARYQELAQLRVRDFDSRTQTIYFAASTTKSSKARRVPLTPEGVELFKELAEKKGGNDLLLIRANGAPWKDGDQNRPMKAALGGAEVKTPFTFHGLRHSYASLLVEAGTPLAYVAEVLGHRDTRMVDKHYAHLAPDHVAETIRKNLPQFGTGTDGKVRSLHE